MGGDERKAGMCEGLMKKKEEVVGFGLNEQSILMSVCLKESVSRPW